MTQSSPGPEMLQFFDLLTAHFKFQFMAGGVECGLFTLLAHNPGLDRGEIAARLELEDRPVRVLLFGCTSVGLLVKQGDRYFASPVGALLSEDHPARRASFVRWEQLRYRGMAWFAESLKRNENVGLKEFPGDGATLYERVARKPELRTAFHQVMGAVASDIAEQIVARFDFSRFRHILDVGGGAAAVFGRAIARRCPEVRVTILDLPEVAELARQRISAEGLCGRHDAIGLDCLKEEFPSGADCILFSHFLEMWSSTRVRELIEKARRAVEPGGSVLIVAPCSDETETGPWLSAHLAAYFQAIATSEGMVYSSAEYEQWVRAAELRPATRVQLPSTFFIEGIKESKQ